MRLLRYACRRAKEGTGLAITSPVRYARVRLVQQVNRVGAVIHEIHAVRGIEHQAE